MHIQKWYLYQPEQEERNHRICGDALVLRNCVLDRQERGPDCPEHYTYSIRPINGLDGEPENGEDGAADDGDIASPETPGCPSDYWEWGVGD